MKLARELTIGTLARRSGVAPSAIRYYEDQGLLRAERTAAGHRRFPRATLRRLALIRLLQRFDFPLSRIREALSGLPTRRTPDAADWTALSAVMREDLDARISALTKLRDELDSCIGCGCLSLASCTLLNPGDAAASRGDGPRYLLGDTPIDPDQS